MSGFVHAQGTKTVHRGGMGVKNGKIMSTQLLNAPLCISSLTLMKHRVCIWLYCSKYSYFSGTQASHRHRKRNACNGRFDVTIQPQFHWLGPEIEFWESRGHLTGTDRPDYQSERKRNKIKDVEIFKTKDT